MPHKSKKAAAKKAKKAAQVKAGKDYVSTTLGLTTVPNTPPPGQVWSGMDSPTSTVAMNLKGKDRWMYGEEASAATNEYLATQTEEAKIGNYFKQVGGEFIRISKEEGEKLTAQGDPSVSASYQLTSAGKEMKYGITEGAMGSGDPTAIMGSTPISNKMLESQNKMQTAIQGVIGMVMPAPGSTIAKLGMAESTADVLQPGAAYEDYTKKFQAKQAGKKFTSTRNLFGLLGLTGHKKKTLGE
jgi:hypothetical protein